MHASIRKGILGLGLGWMLSGAVLAAPPHPPLWKVVKGQSTVYLLGSMHFLKDNDYPMSADVDSAYREADKLMFELPPNDQASPAALVTLMQFGTYHDPNHGLRDDVSSELWKSITAYGSQNGLPEIAVQRFEPWLMAVMMVGLECKKIGLNPESGLDMHFAQLAAKDQKQVSGFETVEQQASIFHNAPTKVQVEMLRQGFEELPKFAQDMELEHDQWRNGDTDQMVAKAKKEFADFPDLYRTMVADRNRKWVPLIEKLLDGRKHGTLVIVGALHLAGADGVASLLRKDGYTVERICTGCTNVH